MLGKLIKHDFKSTGKLLLPMNLLLVAISLIGSVLLGTKLLQRDELLPLSVALLIGYILMLFTFITITGIYLIVNFYRNLFSSQGYLTFTLPASPWSLLHAKTIVGFFWSLLITIITAASVLLLVFSISGYENFGNMVHEIFQFRAAVSSGTESYSSVNYSFADIMGYTPVQFIIIIIIMLIVGSFYSVSIGYVSVTLGQLYARHKVVGTVIAYVAIQFVIQIISGIIIMFLSLRPFLNSSLRIVTEEAEVIRLMRSIYKPMFPALIIIYLVLGIISYIISGIIMNKKVNLD